MPTFSLSTRAIWPLAVGFLLLVLGVLSAPWSSDRQEAAVRSVRHTLEVENRFNLLYTFGYTRNAIVHNGIVDYDVAFLPKPFSVPAPARKVRDVLDSDGYGGQQPPA